MGQAGVLGVQLGPLVFARAQSVQFTHLPLQSFALLVQRIALGSRLFQRLQCPAPGVPRCRQRREVQAGLRVQQCAHGGRPRQALPGVLAVDLHQVLAGLSQLAHRGAAAVDPGPALALGVDGAPHQQAAARGVETGFLHPACQGDGQFELGDDFCTRSAFAHHARLTAAAQGQLQGIDEDGLAGTGFARQHREARADVQVQRVDDDEVLQGDALEHGYTTPSYHLSLRRSVA